jgi:signal transduction histidine kinase
MLSDLVRALPSASVPELRRHGFFGALHQVVDAELRGAFDQVGWEVDAEAERAVGALPGFVSETLYYAAREALRNAARHGRGGESKRQLVVTVSATVAARDPASMQPNGRALQLTICDDGVGVILGSSGPGPTSGTQHGLTLHTTLMAVAGGSLTFESRPAHGTRVDLHMPLADVAEALE